MLPKPAAGKSLCLCFSPGKNSLQARRLSNSTFGVFYEECFVFCTRVCVVGVREEVIWTGFSPMSGDRISLATTQLLAQQGGFWGVMGRYHGWAGTSGAGKPCSNITQHCSGWHYSLLRPPFGVRTCTLLLWHDASSPCGALFTTLRTGSSEALLSQPCLPPEWPSAQWMSSFLLLLCAHLVLPARRQCQARDDRRCHSPPVRKDES